MPLQLLLPSHDCRDMPPERTANDRPPILGTSTADVPPLVPAPRRLSSDQPLDPEPDSPPSTSASTTNHSKDATMKEKVESEAARPDRRQTKDSGVTPPYTIHSKQVRWFIVLLVAAAGMMS